MITKSNKRQEVGVSDAASGTLIKVPKKHYGSSESNPFSPSAIYPNALIRSDRGRFDFHCFRRKFEYDFAETNRILDTEAFVAALFRKKKALILQNEPTLRGRNQKNVDYVQKRLTDMEYVSGVLFEELLRDIVECLVNYNNVFLLIYRNQFSSTGLLREGKQPIAAIYVLSPTRVYPIINEVGDLEGYWYHNKVSSNNPIRLNKDDVYHIYTDKKIDVAVGTPPLEAVKDDIQALRQIEESIENLIYKHTSPLLHVKVGNDKYPAEKLPDGRSEIDYYNELVQDMENEGGLTTSHRVDVSLIGAESHALRAEGSVNYFKQRVVAGLKASLLDIGEADSISTAGANAVSKVLKQDVEAYQKVLERFFTTKLFRDLLLESKPYTGKHTVLKDDEVSFHLTSVDIDDKIRMESHLANLVRYGLLDPEEFSKETGRTLPKNPEMVMEVSNQSSTGVFSHAATPENQHQNQQPADQAVLDSLLDACPEKLFSLTYTYVKDSLGKHVEDGDAVDMAQRISDNIARCKAKGLPRRTISSAISDLIAKEAFSLLTTEETL